MSFEEKLTWVFGTISAIVAVVYFTIVMGQVGQTPVAEIGYQRTLLIAIGASIVLTILGAIVTAIGTAVSAAISAEITGEGSVEDAVGEIDRKDERDVMIDQRGDRVAYYVSSFGMVGVLALTMLEFPHFWIANALYLSFVVANLVATAVKLHAYRRGF